MIPVVWLAMANDNKPFLPNLKQNEKETRIRQTLPLSFNKKEEKKYGGFNDFLKVRKRNFELIKKSKAIPFNQHIRAGFFINWDPQSLYSLQNYIDKMNVVIPEWFHLDSSGALVTDIDTAAFNLVKKHPVKVLPLINNIDYSRADGTWDPERLDKMLNNKMKRTALVLSIRDALLRNGLQGINIDFEELKESSVKSLVAFQKELYDSLRSTGLLVTQDILPNDDNFDPAILQKYNDYIFLMAYDQHYSTSTPGPVSEQRWIEKTLDEAAKSVPSEKIVLCMAGFGYDWPENEEAKAVTYQQALAYSKENNVKVSYDDNSYNCSYEYTNDSNHHRVYFVDAAGNFNTMRFADEYGVAGVALWRLGAEDERLWSFFNRDLSNAALKKDPFNFGSLRHMDLQVEKVDYIDEGEILNVIGFPEKGEINIEVDSVENTITEQDYKVLPIRYVIKRSGMVKNQVILTFDDGPDPEYTPRILNILEKEKVPAAFFIVGINAENHLPLLKRIFREGFEIGNHTFTHPNMALVSGERAGTEMEATRLLLEANTGRSTILFRAPFNADAEPSKYVELKPIERAKNDHYYTVGESIDPEDWDIAHGVNEDTIYNRIVRQYEGYNGQRGVILLHDAGGNREATVRALPRIIKYFKDRHIQFVSIGDILHLSRDEIMPPVHNDAVTLSGWVSRFIYLIGNFMVAAFWMAIILSLGRIVLIGALSFIQLRRSKKLVAPIPVSARAAVSIIVPAFNEEVNAVKTVQNLLLQNYGAIEIIFVDDGSTDATYKNVLDAFAGNPRVRVFTKPNGGKAAALNFGIGEATSEYLVCIDADTQLMPDAVHNLMQYFSDPEVGAVAGNVKVGNEKNMITRWQSIEYVTAQNFDRRAFDLINCITVVPGAIGAFKKAAIIDAGGFTTDTLAEDCDLTIRILRKGYVVRNCSTAIAVTEAPESFRQFMKQRFRWSYGIMQSFWKNKDACFNPKYKALGMVALPNILLFQILVPILAPVADLLFILGLFWNRNDSDSLHKILVFYGIFLLVDIIVSFIAFLYEKEEIKKLAWLIPQRFVYRQLMYVILFRSIRKALKGETQAWGVLKRTGGVKMLRDRSLMKDS